MSVFRPGELLGVDGVTNLKKMAIGEGDPADPAFQAIRHQQAATATVEDSFGGEAASVQYSSPSPAQSMSAADVVASRGGATEQLGELEEEIHQKIQGLFLRAETASYRVATTKTTPSSGSSSGGGSGGGGVA